MKPIDSEKLLGQLLRTAALTPAKAKIVRERKRDDPEALVSEIVRDINRLDEGQFMNLLHAEFGSEFMPPEHLRALQPSAQALARVSSAQAQELAVFPLEYDADKDRLLLLTAYPFNLHVLDELESNLGVANLQLAFTDEETLGQLHQQYYIGAETMLGEGGEDTAFDIGADSDEEAFPGIYGESVASYLAKADPVGAEAGAASEDAGGVRGSLSELGLVDMLQALAHGRKTCALFLESGGWYGNIYLEDGNVVHAETDSKKGEEAVFEILAHPTGHFEIVKRTYSGEKTMNDNVEGLLLEGLRRQDEARR